MCIFSFLIPLCCRIMFRTKSETPARESRFEKTRIFESRSRSRNIRNFDSKLKHGSTRNARGMHTKSLNNRNSAILESDSAANSDTKSKVNYKSPSEKGRDNKRLRKYLYVNNRPETSDTSCQTLLESSDKLTQISPEICDTHCQTSASPMSATVSPKLTFPPPTQTEMPTATPWFAGFLEDVSKPEPNPCLTPGPTQNDSPTSSPCTPASFHSYGQCGWCGIEYADESDLPDDLPPLEKISNPKLNMCGNCGEEPNRVSRIWNLPDMQMCSKCHEIAYCCRECQSEDWRTHHARQCGTVKWEYIRATRTFDSYVGDASRSSTES